MINTNKHLKKMKKVLSCKVLLAYPDFSKSFFVHTGASDYQLGAVISQEGKPIVFYLQKLNNAQIRCTTTKKELLVIAEMLKDFKNILLGERVVVYTDHKK